MQIAFDSQRADFSGIAPSFFISDVIHKTFIEVNEEGTEAAAVTAIEGSTTTAINMTDTRVFYLELNRPFFFAISDSQSSEVLFTGVINDPK